MTLTIDQNKIFKALQPLEPKGSVNFVTSIRIAHVSAFIHPNMYMMYILYMPTYTCMYALTQLTLKHRQNKNQKMKIVAFIGSPITTPEKEVGVASTVNTACLYKSAVYVCVCSLLS